jgi:NAD-dependent dihydropyrimidine dehydrogenase PreA subunit
LIIINTERCNGCGECIAVCPTSALYLVDGKATVDGALCSDCESCIAACPTNAILSAEPVTTPATEPARMPALRPEPEVVWVETHPPVPLRTKVLPVVGAALVWAGREIVPRLAEVLLYDLDRRLVKRQTPGAPRSTPDGSSIISGRGSGRRRRQRRRGG